MQVTESKVPCGEIDDEAAAAATRGGEEGTYVPLHERVTSSGYTPLHLAAENGHADAVRHQSKSVSTNHKSDPNPNIGI